MTAGPDERERPAALSLLRQYAEELAASLPGVLHRIRIRSGDAAIEAEWAVPSGAAGAIPAHVGYADHPAVAVASSNGSAPRRADSEHPAPGGHPATGQSKPTEQSEADGADHAVVTSPLVGTFYRAPEPGADPFVGIGDLVEPGQTVGIVEAMKLMNPIHAEVPGRVSDIHVANGHAVEYGQPLVSLAPLP